MARFSGEFTSLRVNYLSVFIDLTHEKNYGLWKLV